MTDSISQTFPREPAGSGASIASASDPIRYDPRYLAAYERLKPIPIAELSKLPPRQYLIDGLLGKGELSIWYGRAGSGKSFLLLHTAWCVAAGAQWFGRRVAHKVPVIYVAGEGMTGLHARCEAIQKIQGVPAPETFLVINGIPQMRGSPLDVNAVIEHIRKSGAGLVIVDTLNRSFNGGDENASRDMGEFIASCSRIILETGTHVAVVHHSGSDLRKRGRGHTSLEAAADTMIAVENKNNHHSARVTKSRHDRDDWQIQFILQPVKLREDSSAQSISSCFVRSICANDHGPKTALNRNATLALQILMDLTNRSNPNDTSGIHMADWREAVFDQLECADSSRRKLFNRAKSALLEQSLIVIENDFVTLAEIKSAPGTSGTCPAFVPSRPKDIERSSGKGRDTPL